MSRAVSFKQSDMTRAVKAIEAGGKVVTGVDIHPDGSFTVLTGAEPKKPLSALEQWEQEHGDRAA